MKLCNFILGVMEHKVLDAAFPFKLKQLDEVTIKRVRCSRAQEMSGHIDALEGWMKGLDGYLIERFKAYLHGDDECCCVVSCCARVLFS